MMRKLVYCCLFLLLPFFHSYSQTGQQKLLLVGGDNKIHLVDYEKSVGTTPAILWTWDAHQAMDLPAEYRTRKFNTVDDTKIVDNGELLLVSSSSGGVAILRTEDRKVLFYADVPNAHSIEMLPNGRLVAAASTHPEGNKIMMFDINEPNKLLYADSLYSAHGVVWIEERKSLYALGYDVLREYKIAGKDRLTMINEWEIPGKSGHDLYLSPDRTSLFMTEHTGAWVFDLNNHTFDKIDGLPDAEHMKSLGQNQAGQYIFTVPEESWWTFHVSFSNPERKLAFPKMKVYKARWFNK